ncbi:MAG: hypothetical protein EBR27_11935 [Betaproteobacteria bacterium]|nr:hypothetical protein [Betaproteobacteria bacterium]
MSDTRMSDTRMSMAVSMRVDEDLDGGLHEDRRESVDIPADDLRSAIDGAKTLCTRPAQLRLIVSRSLPLPLLWFWHCFPQGSSPRALASLQNDRRERVGISANRFNRSHV